MNSTPSSPQPSQEGPDELIRRHLPLTYRLAASSRRPGARYEDLVQCAGVGLVKAADRFDPRLGVGFDTFATPVIVAELTRSRPERASSSPGSLSVPAGRRAEQVAESERRLSGALGHGSRVRDLARCLDLDADVVAGGLLAAAGREAVTLNLPGPRPRRRVTDRLHAALQTPAAA